MAIENRPHPLDVSLKPSAAGWAKFEWEGFSGLVSGDMELGTKYDETLPSRFQGFLILPEGRSFRHISVPHEEIYPQQTAALIIIDRVMNRETN